MTGDRDLRQFQGFVGVLYQGKEVGRGGRVRLATTIDIPFLDLPVCCTGSEMTGDRDLRKFQDFVGVLYQGKGGG